MKFDVVVGNPPYQIEAGGTSTSDDPIYHHFYNLAEKISEKYILITPARFLFKAGKTPKAWNNKMLEDEHSKIVYYEQKSANVFQNTDIKGGVVVLYHDIKKDFGKIGTFTSYPELNSIMLKVTESNFEPVSSYIYTQSKFNLDVLYKDYPNYKKLLGSGGKDRRFDKPIFSRLDVFTNEQQIEPSYKIIGRYENKRAWRFIPQKYVESHENLNKWKVILPVSNGSGTLGETLSSPFVASPLVGYTRSFISIGSFDNEENADALLKYIKTKFARTMLAILKITQDNTSDKWEKVPWQDFTLNSDINWNKNINEIDQDLYQKYKLNQSEIQFIEERVKPME